jgi:predicted RecA/RadA family phage recombinase
MNNYHQPGGVQTFIAPSGGVVSGGFYVHGTLVVCATHDADETEEYSGKINGVYQVTKAGSQAWTHGAAVYLTAGSATTFTTTSSGNTLAGVAAGTVGSGAGETTGYVLLNGLPDAAV